MPTFIEISVSSKPVNSELMPFSGNNDMTLCYSATICTLNASIKIKQ